MTCILTLLCRLNNSMSKLEAYALDDHAPLQVCYSKIKGIQAVGSIYHHGLPRTCLDENKVLGASYTCSHEETLGHWVPYPQDIRCKEVALYYAVYMYPIYNGYLLLVKTTMYNLIW